MPSVGNDRSFLSTSLRNSNPQTESPDPQANALQHQLHAKHIYYSSPDQPISLFLFNASGTSSAFLSLSPGNFPIFNTSEFDPRPLLIPSTHPSSSSSSSYRLVLCVSVEFSAAPRSVEYTLQSLSLLQQHFSFRAVLFSTSPAAIPLCQSLGIDLVPAYMCESSPFFSSIRSNFATLPVVPELLKACKKLYSADFYGYVNSDILLAPALFPVLDFVLDQYKQGLLTDGVSLAPLHEA